MENHTTLEDRKASLGSPHRDTRIMHSCLSMRCGHSLENFQSENVLTPSLKFCIIINEDHFQQNSLHTKFFFTIP